MDYLEPSPYHDEANEWLRSRGWVSRRSDETWRDCFADDWTWVNTPLGHESTMIIFTGEEFLVNYGYTREELLRRHLYHDTFSSLSELKQHIDMIEAWPPPTDDE